MVDDILDFSKLKNSDIRLNLTAVDVFSAVNTVLTLDRHLVNNKPIQLVNSIPPNSVLVEADENRFLQIMHNLIGNSIKFSESGIVKISAVEENGFVLTSV